MIRNTKGKVTGAVKNGVYRKKVDTRKHFCWKFKGWGNDVGIIDGLPPNTLVELAVDNEYKLTATKERIQSFGTKASLGHGEQYFLQERLWDSDKKNPPLVFRTEIKESEQGSLF